MCDRECRDLARGFEKKSPKKSRKYICKDYKKDGETEDNEDNENKSIIAQTATYFSSESKSQTSIKCDDNRGLMHLKGNITSNIIGDDVPNRGLKAVLQSNSAFAKGQTKDMHSHQISAQTSEQKFDNLSLEEPIERETNIYRSNQLHTVHPVYRTISLINGTINRMDLNQMKIRCKDLQLDCNGKREAVKRRLKEYYKTEKLIQAGLLERRSSDERNSDFFIVVGKKILIFIE